MYTLFHNIKQIVTCSSLDLGIIDCSYGDLAISIDEHGNIKHIDKSANLLEKYNYGKLIDCEKGAVIPGFVDGHTHPVWAGDRIHEFEQKLAGMSYLEIHNAGGGIHFSVEATSRASEDTLYSLLDKRLNDMMRHGTTTVECKTGYGLSWDTESKMLHVLTNIRKNIPMDISITYLSAHAIPKGLTALEHTIDIVQNQIPQLKLSIESGKIECDNIDVFCEKGIFELEESKLILEAGKEIGLNINAHADELYPLGGTEFIANLNALAVSHLEEISEAGIDALKKNQTTAVLLPTTAYLLSLKSPPVRKMISKGVLCALGSDFNPNAYCLSMPIVMHLACINFKMSMTEALLGATINAAHSLGLEKKLGSLEIGKQADFLVLNCSNWQNIIYQFGQSLELIKMVVKKGKIINFNI